MAKTLTVRLPPEVEQYADDIRRFVHAMVYKLKVHHKKGRWEKLTIADVLPLLEGEVAELKEAVDGGNLIEILTEAADVANFAMIVAAIATERGNESDIQRTGSPSFGGKAVGHRAHNPTTKRGRTRVQRRKDSGSHR